MCYMCCKQFAFGWNRSIIKGTLLESKVLFRPISPSIVVLWLRHNTSHSKRIPYKQCKFAWNRSIMKGALLDKKVVFRLYLAFQWRSLLNFILRSVSECATNDTGSVKIGHKWRALCLETKYCFLRICDLNRAVIKGTLQGEQITFAPVSRLPSEQSNWDFIPRTVRSCRTSKTSLVEIGQYWRELYSRPRYFSSIFHFPLAECKWGFIPCTTCACATKMQVWLISVNNEGHFTWRSKYLLVCISPYIRSIFLKPHNTLFFISNSTNGVSLIEIGHSWPIFYYNYYSDCYICIVGNN